MDLSKDKLAMQRLREAAEKAKRELDGLASTEVSLPFITADATGPKHLNIKVTKAKFEALVEKLVERTMGPCEKCVKDANVKKADIDEVLLVGGVAVTRAEVERSVATHVNFVLAFHGLNVFAYTCGVGIAAAKQKRGIGFDQYPVLAA